MASFRQLLEENQQLTGRRIEQLTQVEKALLLQSVPLFASLPEGILLSLAAIAEEVVFAAKEQVLAAGSMGSCLYIVVKGGVQVHQDGRSLAQLGVGEFFGEMALLTPEPRMATVTAVSAVTLLRLNRDTFTELVDSNSQIARSVITALAQRLRTITRTYTRAESDQFD